MLLCFDKGLKPIGGRQWTPNLGRFFILVIGRFFALNRCNCDSTQSFFKHRFLPHFTQPIPVGK
jgi:hypothetical protein